MTNKETLEYLKILRDAKMIRAEELEYELKKIKENIEELDNQITKLINKQ